jgi:hypothetical protein
VGFSVCEGPVGCESFQTGQKNQTCCVVLCCVVLSRNVKLCNVRKSAVFHVIPGRIYSQSLVRNVGAASDSVEWNGLRHLRHCKLTVAVALVKCVLCCCTLSGSCEAVVWSVQCATGLTQSSMLLHSAGSYHRNSQPSGTLFHVGFVVHEAQLPNSTRCCACIFFHTL